MSGKGSKGKGVKRPRSTDADTSSAANGAFAGAVAKTLGKQLPAKNPIMAKRHTSSMKSSKAEAKLLRERKRAKAKGTAGRRALSVPSVLEKGYERSLTKVATKGVVALFNAIAQHQKSGPADQGKAEAADGKDTFMSLLRKQHQVAGVLPSTGKASTAEAGEDAPAPKKKGWDVLQDDYLSKQWGLDAADAAAADEDDWDTAGALAAAVE